MGISTITEVPAGQLVSQGVAADAALPTAHARLWLTAAMLFVVLRALPILSYPPGRDQSTYLLIGQSLAEGKLLYRDLWDNKPPGIFWLYAGISKLFGAAVWGVALVDILWLLAISYCIFRFTARFLGPGAAAVAVAIHASWHARVSYGYIYSAQPETFQLLCVFGGFFLMQQRSRRWGKAAWFTAGLLLGYAFWLKYNAVAFLPFVLVLPYLDTSRLDRHPRRVGLTISWRDWLGRVAFLGGGFSVMIAGVFAWIALSGAWPAMKEIQFEVLPRYAAMGIHSRAHYWTAVAVRTTFFLGAWTEIATVAALLIAWRGRDLARSAPIFVATAIAYAATVMQVRLHSYYFQTCFPFLAMIWGYLVLKAYQACRSLAYWSKSRHWKLAPILVWILFANLIFWPLPAEFDSLSMDYESLNEWRKDAWGFYSAFPQPIYLEHLKGQLETVRYLKQNLQPGEEIFLWGAHCLIYYLSGTLPPTRFVSNLGLVSTWSPPAWREELVRDLEQSPPRFIVVARGDELPSITYTELDSEQYLRVFPRLRRFLSANYSPVADFDSFVVYRRE
jgi:4-amino-4-deoxy-L-arabinose transferase-like glycosyltransferase